MAEEDGDGDAALLRLLEEENARLAKDHRAVSLQPAAVSATAAAQATKDKDKGKGRGRGSGKDTQGAAEAVRAATAADAATAAAATTTNTSTATSTAAEAAAAAAASLPPPTAKATEAQRLAAAAAAEEEARFQAERVLVHQWGEALTSPETFLKRRAKRMAELALAGIPAALRCLAWQQLARAKARLSAQAAGRAEGTDDAPQYPELLARDSPHEKMIRRDIARTFPTHSLFRDKEGVGQETLFNVIKAYSLYDTEVGYCQGSPFVVGLLLMHMPEEDAFHMLTILMRDYKLRGLFKPSMADLPLRLYQLDRLIQNALPDLHAHFADLCLEPSMYASQWFLTLFASTLPLSLVFRIIDVFLVEGTTAIFRAALALLSSSHDALLRQNFEGAMEGLTRGSVFARFEGREDDFMAVFRGVAVPTKRLQRFEQDYAKSRAEEEAQRSELARYKAECERLKEENTAMRAQVGAAGARGGRGVDDARNSAAGIRCAAGVLPLLFFPLSCSSSNWKRRTACLQRSTSTRVCSSTSVTKKWRS